MKKYTYLINLLLLLTVSFSVSSQRIRGGIPDEFMFSDDYHDAYGLSSRNVPGLEDLNFLNSNSFITSGAFNIAVNNEYMVSLAKDRAKTAWRLEQENKIRELLEDKFGQDFSTYNEAKDFLFENIEINNIARNVIQPRIDFTSLVSNGFERRNTDLKDLKLLAIRENELNTGNINNSQYGYIKVNDTYLKDIVNLSQISQIRAQRVPPFEENIAITHENKYTRQKLYNLGLEINEQAIDLKHAYYNDVGDEWEELNYMQFLINFEEIKRLTTAPYYYPDLINLFNKFKDTDQASSNMITVYARSNREGGHSIFSNAYFDQLLQAAYISNQYNLGYSDLYSNTEDDWREIKNTVLEEMLNSLNINEILAEAAITSLDNRNVDFLNDRPLLKQKVLEYFIANQSSNASFNLINDLLNQFQDGESFLVDPNVYFSTIDLLTSNLNEPNRAIEFCSQGEGDLKGLPHFGNVLTALFEVETDNDFKGFIIREMFSAKGIHVPSQTDVSNSWYGENFKFVNQESGCVRIDFLNEYVNNTPPDCQTSDYEDAIRNGDLVFTKKYGWVDTNHAFTNTARTDPYIGVENLWRQLENPPLSSQISNGYYSINYKQDVVVFGLSIGIERQYLLKPGLNIEQRKSVALAIFQDVSIAFESLQSLHPTSTSSFSPEDLPSNMISFYRNVEGYSESYIRDTIETVSVAESLSVFRLYPCTFADKQYKNKTFTPKRFESPYTSGDVGIPSIFNTIQPFVIKTIRDFGNADLILWSQDIISN
jgi:hypothetical protein